MKSLIQKQPIRVYLTNSTWEQEELAKKIVEASGLTVETVWDLQEVKKLQPSSVITVCFGEKARQILEKYKISCNLILPDISKCENIPENRESRRQVWKKVQEFSIGFEKRNVSQDITILAELENEQELSIQLDNQDPSNQKINGAVLTKKEAELLTELSKLLGIKKLTTIIKKREKDEPRKKDN